MFVVFLVLKPCFCCEKVLRNGLQHHCISCNKLCMDTCMAANFGSTAAGQLQQPINVLTSAACCLEAVATWCCCRALSKAACWSSTFCRASALSSARVVKCCLKPCACFRWACKHLESDVGCSQEGNTCDCIQHQSSSAGCLELDVM